MALILPRDSLAEVIFGPAVFMGFFILSYITVGAGCLLGWQHVDVIAWLGGIRVLIIAEAGVTLIVLVLAAVSAWVNLRQAREAHGGHAPEEPRKDRRYFLALSSLCLIGFGVLGTLWVTMAFFLVPTC